MFLSTAHCLCCAHRTAVLNQHLRTVTGQNYNKKQHFNITYTTAVDLPNTHTVKCEIPKPCSFHGLEKVNENELLIMGGELYNTYQ